jgi:DNA-binding NtrC family response regulator
VDRETIATVLIVEDDVFWQEQYSKVLNNLGFKTISVTSLAQAIDQINQQRFDLAIVDMNLTLGLPQDEGLLILEQISRREESIAVIVSTGYPTVDMVSEGYEKYNIDKFYQKREWTPNGFGDIVETIMSRRSNSNL